MIQYETNSSQFFVHNKIYCETITDQLKTLNADCTGYCNSFGFDIEASWKRSTLSYTLKIIKAQTTENGVIIPMNSNDYVSTEVSVKGVNTKPEIVISRSAFKRFFISNLYKKLLPAPYYINMNFSPERDFIDTLVMKIKTLNITKFKMNNGIVICKLNIAPEQPLALIEDLEFIIKNCT